MNPLAASASCASLPTLLMCCICPFSRSWTPFAASAPAPPLTAA